MDSAPSSAPLNLRPPTLLIDFRSGSVETRLGNVVWRALLPLNSADCSQINTPMVTVESSTFEPLRDNED